jgi:membrane fusion protein (multidrug efflux system)
MSDAEGYTALGEAEADAAVKGKRASWLQRFRWPMMIGGPLILVAVAAWFILNAGKTQSTDDAYVQIAKAPVAASISGRVVEVMVTENQHVRRGQPLFRLDPRDLAVAADESAAKLAQAEGQVLGLHASWAQAHAKLAQARTTLAFAQREAARQRALYDAGVGSKDDADKAAHAVETARADIATARAAELQAAAYLGGPPNGSIRSHPLVQAARADVERTRLNQSYGVIVAPTDGVVTRVDQLQPGAYVNAAQTVFWLIRGTPWVEANFKEDQIGKMRVGQPAVIKIDAFPKVEFAAHVESFSPGTGQVFSALPAQNATGNWVKVTQRLPVRIAFDRPPPEMAARGGLSAHVKVDVEAAPEHRSPPRSTPRSAPARR